MTNDPEVLQRVGERITAIRKRLNMPQSAFARAMGVSNGSVSMMETGKNEPRFELLYNLATKYNLNFYYLLFGQGDMFLPYNFDPGFDEKKYGLESETWLRKFFHYFNESEIFRYWVMSTIEQYLMENQARIDKNIKVKDGAKV